jgi:hypothetical protein
VLKMKNFTILKRGVLLELDAVVKRKKMEEK